MQAWGSKLLMTSSATWSWSLLCAVIRSKGCVHLNRERGRAPPDENPKMYNRRSHRPPSRVGRWSACQKIFAAINYKQDMLSWRLLSSTVLFPMSWRTGFRFTGWPMTSPTCFDRLIHGEIRFNISRTTEGTVPLLMWTQLMQRTIFASRWPLTEVNKAGLYFRYLFANDKATWEVQNIHENFIAYNLAI